MFFARMEISLVSVSYHCRMIDRRLRPYLLKYIKMIKHAGSMTKNPQPTQQLRVGREFADTTWRVCLPVLLFAGAGIMADRALGSQPWLTLLGTAVGLIGAAHLIRLQIRRWPVLPVKPGSYERNRRPGDPKDDDEDDD